MKEGSSDYKKVRKRWFFKEPLTEWFFVEPKMVLLWHRCEEPFEAPLFLRLQQQCDATPAQLFSILIIITNIIEQKITIL